LNTYLAAVFAKKYNNPTTDIITVLAGLESIDAVFSDFVSAIDTALRIGRDGEQHLLSGQEKTGADGSISGPAEKSR
jgi:hypothetical protein